MALLQQDLDGRSLGVLGLARKDSRGPEALDLDSAPSVDGHMNE